MLSRAHAKFLAKKALRGVSPFTKKIEHGLSSIHYKIREPRLSLDASADLEAIRKATLEYVDSLKIESRGKFLGYRHSASTSKPILYSTVAAVLTKHLYGCKQTEVEQELATILKYQDEDGLFRDRVIQCRLAETEDSWGWRHLTLHALMALSLYGVRAKNKMAVMEPYLENPKKLRDELETRDWGARAAWTSNEIQNLGTMLQYIRDTEKDARANKALAEVFDVIERHQDHSTGLYGESFSTPEELSLGVQAGYHFWMLYFYDKRPVAMMERIIDSALATQNVLGGYGVQWNSSACEDIDSIDPLVRLSRLTAYRRSDVIQSLIRAKAAVCANLNSDGGWVFRRHEALTVVHPQMYSATNESNLFYTWFRTLGLAYCIKGLEFHGIRDEKMPSNIFNFKSAPGHQFLV